MRYSALLAGIRRWKPLLSKLETPLVVSWSRLVLQEQLPVYVAEPVGFFFPRAR